MPKQFSSHPFDCRLPLRRLPILPCQLPAQSRKLPIPNSIIVVFQGQALPADAAARLQRAGGTAVSTMNEFGVLVAQPATANSATLIDNLRQDSAILDADYDRMLSLIAPNQVSSEMDPVSQTDIAHPGPTFSSALPADFLYTSSPQQRAVKGVGANGAWDITKGAGVKMVSDR